MPTRCRSSASSTSVATRRAWTTPSAGSPPTCRRAVFVPIPTQRSCVGSTTSCSPTCPPPSGRCVVPRPMTTLRPPPPVPASWRPFGTRRSPVTTGRESCFRRPASRPGAGAGRSPCEPSRDGRRGGLGVAEPCPGNWRHRGRLHQRRDRPPRPAPRRRHAGQRRRAATGQRRRPAAPAAWIRRAGRGRHGSQHLLTRSDQTAATASSASRSRIAAHDRRAMARNMWSASSVRSAVAYMHPMVVIKGAWS